MAKFQDRIVISSQIYIFVETVVLPALRSSFVRYKSSRSQMFYKIGALNKHPQSNTSVGVSFVKETPIQTFSCEFFGIFLEYFFYGTPPVAAFVENFFFFFFSRRSVTNLQIVLKINV